MKTIPASVRREIAARMQSEPKRSKQSVKSVYITIGWITALTVVIVTLSACGLIPKY